MNADATEILSDRHSSYETESSAEVAATTAYFLSKKGKVERISGAIFQNSLHLVNTFQRFSELLEPAGLFYQSSLTKTGL